MKNLLLIISLLMSLTACSQKQKGNLTIAICEKGNGCTEVLKKYDKNEIAQILKRPDLFSDRKENSILVIEKCDFKEENKLTIPQLHTQYGGKGEAKKIADFDLEKYLKQNQCLPCPNPTKKISVSVSSPEFSGNSYFFISWDKKEAYMPNDAFQQLYAGQEGFSEMTVDAFFKDYQYISYLNHPESGKWKSNMPIGTSVMSFGNDKENEARFKRDFKATGNKRPHLNTPDFQYEYRGKDDEGKPLVFWLGPSYDVCLPPGKFDALGFFNLGYIAVDGIAYSVMEISGPDIKFRITAIENGSYSFNTAGYKSIGR
ncbi:hypothetical protein [Soonwooa sp.]|uniref:hypothetical protein n=1 Tax=Soonwooa sp. TaxID=1938592 RepID=UPI0028AF27A1|nr:hypothetical protein [Soonwooa sp.]